MRKQRHDTCICCQEAGGAEGRGGGLRSRRIILRAPRATPLPPAAPSRPPANAYVTSLGSPRASPERHRHPPRPLPRYDAHHMKEPIASPTGPLNPDRCDMWCGRRSTGPAQSNHRPRIRIARRVPVRHERTVAVDGGQMRAPPPRMYVLKIVTSNSTCVRQRAVRL